MSDEDWIKAFTDILNGRSNGVLNWETKKEFIFTNFKRVFGIETLENRLEETIEKTMIHIEYQIILNDTNQKQIAELKEEIEKLKNKN